MTRRTNTQDRLQDAERRVVIARLFARRLWSLLSDQWRELIDRMVAADGFVSEYEAIIDPAFAAAEALFDRHRIYAEPCRGNPDKTVRNVMREQLLMMGGQPPENWAS